jgi:cytochrome bd-type quinol oxidase subunit 2
LTVANAASPQGSLTIGIVWLSVGLAIAVAHTLLVYSLFRGKGVLEADGHY